jgi:uncharacterized protein with beta-barrel porin domain
MRMGRLRIGADGHTGVSFFDTMRVVSFMGETPQAAPRAWNLDFDVGAGYDMPTRYAGRDLVITPEARLRYGFIHIFSWKENRSNAALSVQDDQTGFIRSSLGINGLWLTHVRHFPLSVRLRVAWEHEYLDRGHSLSATFAQGQTNDFAIELPGTSPDRLFMSSQVAWQVGKRVSLHIHAWETLGTMDRSGGLRFGLASTF